MFGEAGFRKNTACMAAGPRARIGGAAAAASRSRSLPLEVRLLALQMPAAIGVEPHDHASRGGECVQGGPLRRREFALVR